MSTVAAERKSRRSIRQPRDAASLLGLAASPAFALMAWVCANDIHSMIGTSGSDGLPIGGMSFMYLLMSLFHLPPWLRFVSALSRQSTQAATQAQGE